jgi:hypothetical protein
MDVFRTVAPHQGLRRCARRHRRGTEQAAGTGGAAAEQRSPLQLPEASVDADPRRFRWHAGCRPTGSGIEAQVSRAERRGAEIASARAGCCLL